LKSGGVLNLCGGVLAVLNLCGDGALENGGALVEALVEARPSCGGHLTAVALGCGGGHLTVAVAVANCGDGHLRLEMVMMAAPPCHHHKGTWGHS
jgi:hypothetical protein